MLNGISQRIVQALTVAEDSRNIVWQNLMLVHATSPDEAYGRALNLGNAGDTQYLNPAGKLVTVRFRDISYMDVIHDTLEHGAELTFHSQCDVAPERMDKLVRSKEELELLLRNSPSKGPDVASEEIVKQVQEEFGITGLYTK